MKLKNKLSYALYFLLVAVFISCKNDNATTSKTGEILQGKHELRRFKVTTESGYKWSASYFLIAGGGSGGTYRDTKASFSWRMNTGEYAISEIELGKIRIRIDSTVNIPYVNFHWDKSDRTDLERIFNYEINYMIITCKEEDYPVSVDINSL